MVNCKAQNTKNSIVSGVFKKLPNTNIRLVGVEGIKEKVFVTASTDSLGYFSLVYPNAYKGIGVIQVFKKGAIKLLLNNKPIELEMANIKDLKTLVFKKNKENKLFYNYNNKALLDKDIPKNSYLDFYIKTKNFIEANINTTNFKDYNTKFKVIDLQDEKLVNSGLWGSLLATHFNKITKSFSAKEVNEEYKKAIDHIFKQVNGYDELVKMTGELLIKQFGNKNLTSAAAYLSEKILEEQSCVIEDSILERKLKQHRDMVVGKKAPEIIFSKSLKNNATKLSDIKSKKLIVFWASWCGHCTAELPMLQKLYPQLQKQGIEVVSISLDTEQTPFLTNIETTNWVNYCDFKKWDSPVAKDYNVFSTPTLYVLNATNDILLKPKNVTQIEQYLKLLASFSR